VISDLGAQPDEMLFIDDRAENTRTARELGMRTITFTPPAISTGSSASPL